MLVRQNWNWNQVLISLKSNCKGCDGFALSFKVFDEQVSVCWFPCIFCSFCYGSVLSISAPQVFGPPRGRSTRCRSIKYSVPAGSWRSCFSPGCSRVYALMAANILVPQEGWQTSCKLCRDEGPLSAQDLCRFHEAAGLTQAGQSPTVWNLIKAHARFHTWDRVIGWLYVQTGRWDWRAAPWKGI